MIKLNWIHILGIRQRKPIVNTMQEAWVEVKTRSIYRSAH